MTVISAKRKEIVLRWQEANRYASQKGLSPMLANDL
jgi:hypothetical protein